MKKERVSFWYGLVNPFNILILALMVVISLRCGVTHSQLSSLVALTFFLPGLNLIAFALTSFLTRRSVRTKVAIF